MSRTRTTRFLILAGAMAAAPAAATGAELDVARFQAEAKGLAEGPLCSLVLHVNVGKTLDLVVAGASRDAGWGKIGPSPAALGTICLPDANQPETIERSGDWSAGRLVATFSGGRKLTIHASQMSQGIVIETSTDRLRLFAGEHERLVGKDSRGRVKVYGFPGQTRPMGPVTPAYAAVPDGAGLKTSAVSGGVSPPPSDSAWMMVYWGDRTHFVASHCPLTGRGLQSDAYLADCPVLLVFDAAPRSIRPAAEGGLDLVFQDAGHRLAVLPVSPAGLLPAQVTANWQASVTDGMSKALRGRAAGLRHYPISVRRSFRYDAANDEAVFTEKLRFLPVGQGGEKLTVLPPVAAVAMTRRSMSIRSSPGLRDQMLWTELGPIIGVAGTESVTWAVGGLSRCIEPVDDAPVRGEAPRELTDELAGQIRRMLDAGRLRPWCYADNIPINDTRGELYWAEPAEALYLLDMVRGVLPDEKRRDLTRYMAELCSAHPPQKVALMPLGEGKQRGGYDPPVSKAGQSIAKERAGRVSVFALYGLERCLALTGRKPDPASWQACRKLLADAFAEQNWATLYLLGHGERRLPWMKKDEQDQRANRSTSQWRGDRPAAVVNVNRMFAGAVGAIRLARVMEDKEAEQLGWRLLARSAVLRVAMGRLPAWRVEAGLARIPKDPAWQWRLESGSWGGYLETPDWSRPGHDVRQVVELGQDGPRYDDFGGTAGDLWYQRTTAQLVAFRYMVPELARFLRDHLKGETAELCRRIEQNLPHWYASFSEAILGWEHNMNHPSDAFGVFLARAWVLDERPERLTRWIDVPWLERGDLFYMNKLAATIRAYRAASARKEAR